ncbi:MAG TPA: hypothetical protein VLF20_04425 [Patescibacteria group bacterium]|nr:hypothetical protein [Patescibacteria group bacterium]
MTEQAVDISQRSPQVNEFEFGHGKFVVVRAMPSGENEVVTGEKQRPIVYLPGHNLNPRTGVAKATFDIQQIANASGSEVLSFVFLGGRSKSVEIADGYPDGAKIPEYYRDKASDMLEALRKMREEGKLDGEPLDLIGYSDGGAIALTMVEHYPNAFGNVELVNSVGIDGRSTIGTAIHVPIELGKVATGWGRQRGGTPIPKGEKLRFEHNEGERMTARQKVQQLITEERAIARSHVQTLIPHLLKRNPQLHFGIYTTDNDSIVSAPRTRSVISSLLQKGETRVTFGTTGWDQHMISTREDRRGSRLQDMGGWMRGMRQGSIGNRG